MYIKGTRHFNKQTKEIVTIEAIYPTQLLVSYYETVTRDNFVKEYIKRYELYNYTGKRLEALTPDDAA